MPAAVYEPAVEEGAAAGLAVFLQKHTTAEKLAHATYKSYAGRGGFNMKIKKNNQLSTGWYHSEGQYVAALRLAFLTEKKVRPPTPRPLGCFLLTPVQAREPRPGCRCHPHHATAATYRRRAGASASGA